jgi:hypothetical protein
VKKVGHSHPTPTISGYSVLGNSVQSLAQYLGVKRKTAGGYFDLVLEEIDGDPHSSTRSGVLYLAVANIDVVAIPEPGLIGLVAVAAAAFALRRRARARARIAAPSSVRTKHARYRVPGPIPAPCSIQAAAGRSLNGLNFPLLSTSLSSKAGARYVPAPALGVYAGGLRHRARIHTLFLGDRHYLNELTFRHNNRGNGVMFRGGGSILLRHRKGPLP